MPRITISYRRDDSGVITGRIFDRLAGHYGRDAVFRDIDNIPPGVDFRQHIAEVLDESDILLAIVGPRWLGPRGGQNRLDDEADPVRLEIETGLRKQMPVIPVLVLRAGMPRVSQLPDSVKDFAFRHAVQVDADQDFDVHSARLIRAMDRILEQRGASVATAALADQDVPEPIAEPEPAIDIEPLRDEPVTARAEPAVRAEPVARTEPPIVDLVPAPTRARSAERHGNSLWAIIAALGVGAAVAAGIAFFVRPSAPPDVMALATAKEAAETRALSLQAELTAAQKKAASAQDSLDAAQQQAADQGKRLSDLQAAADQAAKDAATQKDKAAKAQAQVDQLTAQLKALGDQQSRADKAEAAQKQLTAQVAAAQDKLAAAQKSLDQQAAELNAAQSRADKAETAAKQLSAQLSAGQDKGSTAQKLLDQQAAQLGDANARADRANKDLAAQKDSATKAQAQIDDLQNQLKTEKKAHDDADATIAQLNGQLKSLKEQAAAPPVPPTAAAPLPVDDSAWTVDQRREAQTDLVALGHLQGNADGNFGPSTRTAIKQFQSFIGDPETGVLTDAEASALHGMAQHLSALLMRGESSPNGVSAAAVKGAAQRYQRGWTAEKGSNGAADPTEAVYWYGLAAADGDGKALTNLGTLLVRGRGVPRPDPDAAAVLWEVAAARGETTAMFNLGAMWEHGIGVASDLDKAKAWYQRAAAKGDAGARAALKRLGA